jgi:membrane protease YdiL (CAAX protease family)
MSQPSQQTELECKECKERNPPRFEVCWNCGKSLEDAKRVESSETADENDKRQTWGDLYRLISSRWLDWCELLAVVLATCAYSILVSIFRERAAAVEEPTVLLSLAIPRQVGWIVLLWLLIRRDRAVKQPVPLAEYRWHWELFFAAAILAAKFALRFAVTSLARDWGVPQGEPSVFVEMTHASQWAVYTTVLFFSAIYEEVLFRAYLQSKIESLIGEPILAVLLSAALFAAVHGYAPRSSLQVFASGILFGTIYQFSRSLPRLVLSHWSYNLLAAWLRQH